MATRPRCFCVSKARPQAAAGADPNADGDASDALALELRGLGLKELRGRAKAAGMPASELEAAMDSDEPEQLFVDFVVQARVQTDKTDAAYASMEAELRTLRVSELRRRAKAAGVAEDALEEAMDADDP